MVDGAPSKDAYVAKNKALCPTPLNADDAEWAAQYVEEHRADKGAIWIGGRLWKMNAETRACRGVK